MLKMEKRNRIAVQKEAVMDDSSSSSLRRLRKRWDEAEADKVDNAEPADDWDIDLKGSGEPEPEAVHNILTSKKDKKKMTKSVKLIPSWMVESPAPTTDADLEQGTVPITKRDKYPERHSRVHSDDFQSLSFPLLAPCNSHDKTCEPAAINVGYLALKNSSQFSYYHPS
jgi:hypothetical protein